MGGGKGSPNGTQRKFPLIPAAKQSYSLGARWIHTMLDSPLEDHWINVANDEVESITEKPAHTPTLCLDGRTVIPGAVNAHAHLELSQLASPLDVPSRSVSDWVTALLAFRRSAEYDAEQGIQTALRRQELLTSTVAVADIVPGHLAGTPALTGVPAKLFTFQWLRFAELIAWQSDAAETLNFDSNVFGLSPHAPHTVCRTLLERAVDQKIPLAMHLAETPEELQLLRHHTGPLLELMRRADADYNPLSVLLGKRPMDYLRLLAAAPSVFIIHGNYLDDEELRFLAAHRETMSVVYCPRSHAYFRHTPYPLKKMWDYGIRVLLGTDSLASVPDLNFVEEMQFVLRHHPAVLPEVVYRMGTTEGAAAFNLPEGFGTIQPGGPARFAAL